MLSLPFILYAKPAICVNQIGYNLGCQKNGVVVTDFPITGIKQFDIINVRTGKTAFHGTVLPCGDFKAWGEKNYYRADFSMLETSGKYYIRIPLADTLKSPVFEIGESLLALKTLPALLHYFRNQRANTVIELENDKSVQLFGSDKKVDLSGGWCDASGDVSKYFSHLAYANFFSPQQIPLVTWSLADAAERIPSVLNKLHLQDSVVQEAIYGADYLLKSLSREGYFYMIVFSYFNKDPKARRVVGLLANSITTDDYQCAFREGGGMAIAALAKISRWKEAGSENQSKYILAAKRAYAHLKVNNLKYCDDGKENIIDDYCALMAAVELFKATSEGYYLQECRARISKLKKRLTLEGYFLAGDSDRPFFHASDAGLPLIAIKNYLKIEKDKVLELIGKRILDANLDYQLHISATVVNPFGYARQTIESAGVITESFFIPHENETGWWWQGENARLASLASAGFLDGKSPERKNFAIDQLNWILGCNPYQTCFMFGFGENNVPYMASNYGHGTQIGGISNGITGMEGGTMGQGIEFKREANGNEWRWTEQWLPHAAWFLQAITALESNP